MHNANTPIEHCSIVLLRKSRTESHVTANIINHVVLRIATAPDAARQ